ncbi:uncharacterized protein LOC111056277 isoform X3 [Nilaparvata lugens]|uniref:uncharacterized protein LOC111056277 isoform X3 n=1 Tax=Nilaparvata lugens TaxID=108931 RepID=UPI00193DBED7|nr:uncharacterized protein LOC111056277 isoform X3 [Nilaparvata lugens]
MPMLGMEIALFKASSSKCVMNKFAMAGERDDPIGAPSICLLSCAGGSTGNLTRHINNKHPSVLLQLEREMRCIDRNKSSNSLVENPWETPIILFRWKWISLPMANLVWQSPWSPIFNADQKKKYCKKYCVAAFRSSRRKWRKMQILFFKVKLCWWLHRKSNPSHQEQAPRYKYVKHITCWRTHGP